LSEASGAAATNNSDVQAARASLTQARLGVTVARYAYLPSFALDVFYGIDANQFAATSKSAEDTGRSTLPHFEVPYRQNLGYVAQATLNIPLWNWGSIHSKVKQAALKEQQAELDLTTAQKQLDAELQTSYREAQIAFSQVESLRSSAKLAAESLRLTLLRYEAGEATALEVADAQTTVSQARGAYDDGLLRYRTAVANLQILTGGLTQRNFWLASSWWLRCYWRAVPASRRRATKPLRSRLCRLRRRRSRPFSRSLRRKRFFIQSSRRISFRRSARQWRVSWCNGAITCERGS
jgi:outer membrane protein TolC